MKLLIWIGCFFVGAMLNVLLGAMTGFQLGYLLFYLVVGFVATRLCKKWDEHKEYGGLGKDVLDADPQSVVENDNRLEQQFAGRTYTTPVSDSQWQCSCGRVHPKYETSCVCGKSKFDNLNSPKTEGTSSETAEKPATGNQILFCRKCGEKLMEDSKFCGRCGTKIVKE